MDEQLSKMREVLEARLKAEPGNAEAWRELAEVKMMSGDADGAENGCLTIHFPPLFGPCRTSSPTSFKARTVRHTLFSE